MNLEPPGSLGIGNIYKPVSTRAPAHRNPTSGGARLISSSSSQAPPRSARTSAPSWNANAKPPSATAAARFAAASSHPKRRQSSLRQTETKSLCRMLHAFYGHT